MPDERLLHLCLGHSAKVNRLSDFERLVWIVYKLAADDYGVMRFSAAPLQDAADWLEERPSKLVTKALDQIRDVGLVATFTHQGRTYVFQGDWQTWQKITFPRATSHPLPPADRCDLNTQWLFTAHPKGAKLSGWQHPDLRTKKGVSSSGATPVVTTGVSQGVTPEVVRELLPPRVDRSVDRSVDQDHDRARAPVAQSKDTLALRAGAFVERYKRFYVQFRAGAQYVGTSENFDYLEAVKLVKVYEDARLDKLAEVWLKTDHDFAENGTRTLAKFRSMATWCDERLRKAGL